MPTPVTGSWIAKLPFTWPLVGSHVPETIAGDPGGVPAIVTVLVPLGPVRVALMVGRTQLPVNTPFAPLVDKEKVKLTRGAGLAGSVNVYPCPDSMSGLE